MLEPPFEPYHGDQPFVFVSYAHDDRETVYADLAWLHGLRVRLWYDDGIRGGEEWADAIGRAVKRCACILVFVSPRSAASPHCRDELTMALNRGKRLLAVHLEPTELPEGLELRMSKTQALQRHALAELLYRRKLAAALPEDVRPVSEDLRPAPRPVARGDELRLGGVLVRVSADREPPFALDAEVLEEDTFLVLSADTEVAMPREHPLRVIDAAVSAEPLAPGSVRVRRGTPLRLLAVVHDLSSDPTCREEWVEAALAEVVALAEGRRLAAVSLPLLGTVHGRIQQTRALLLTRRALETAERYPQHVWLRVPRGVVAAVRKGLRG